MIRKIIDSKALDIDTKNRKVKVAISRMGNPDKDNDIIDHRAFDLTIASKGPGGTNEVWHLTDHGWRIADSALSKYDELSVQGDMLVGVAPYRDTFLWREVAWPLYEAGDITQHSIGFRVVKQEIKEGAPRLIKEVELFEGSAVLWGANPQTPTLDIVKSHLENKRESFEERIDWIVKSIKAGKYRDEESLLILELKQLDDIYNISRKGSSTRESDKDAQKLMMDVALILHKHL